MWWKVYTFYLVRLWIVKMFLRQKAITITSFCSWSRQNYSNGTNVQGLRKQARSNPDWARYRKRSVCSSKNYLWRCHTLYFWAYIYTSIHLFSTRTHTSFFVLSSPKFDKASLSCNINRCFARYNGLNAPQQWRCISHK